MTLDTNFKFEKISDIRVQSPLVEIAQLLNPLGPLQDLPGKWTGTGFNTIWRPHFGSQDRFLELDLTKEVLEFVDIGGDIPNRGLLQPDMKMHGLTYMQRIDNQNGPEPRGLHIEPGIWAVVPHTTTPSEPRTVVRMGSIPHGSTILAQGVATSAQGGPNIPDINIRPIPDFPSVFTESDLATPTAFRSDAAHLIGIDQSMVDNPNTVLKKAIAGQHIISTTTLNVTTGPNPVAGGGTANTAFLDGAGGPPNARAAEVMSTFWIETVKDPDSDSHFLQLQYSQTVMLDFVVLDPQTIIRWPHVSVGTLRKEGMKLAPFDPKGIKLVEAIRDLLRHEPEG